MYIVACVASRMLAGASWQGFGAGSGGSHSSSFNRHQLNDSSATDGPTASPHIHGSRSRQQRGCVQHRCSGDGCETTCSDLATEATSLSSLDWQGSLDASEGASLCASMSFDHSLEGSLLDSVDLAASNEAETCLPGRVEARAEAGCCSCSCHQQAATAGEAGGVAADAAAGPVTGVHDGLAEATGAACCQCCSVDGASRERKAVPPFPCVASHAEGVAGPGPECFTARFGPVIRTLGTGDSFGELALLQCSATRTATVMVAADSSPSNTMTESGLDAAAASGALLIKISRSCYDSTVRALQVSWRVHSNCNLCIMIQCGLQPLRNCWHTFWQQKSATLLVSGMQTVKGHCALLQPATNAQQGSPAWKSP